MYQLILLCGLFTQGGVCPPEGCIPPSNEAVESIATETDAQKWSSVGLVIVNETNRQKSLGTGFLIYADEYSSLWVTASHVVGGSPQVIVRANGKDYSCRVETRKGGAGIAGADYAVLLGPATDLKPVRIRVESAVPHEDAYILGYAAGRRFSAQRGKVQRSNQAMLEISTVAYQGQSGGPVIDSEGMVIGILWGTNGSQAMATPIRYVTTDLETGNHTWLPWRRVQEENNKLQRQIGELQNELQRERALTPQLIPPAKEQVEGEYKKELETLKARLEQHILQSEQKYNEVSAAIKTIAGKVDVKVDLSTWEKEKESVAEEAAKKSTKGLRGWLLAIFGGSSALTIIIVVIVLLAVRRDIKNRIKTGDPLEIERVLHNVASFTPNKIDDKLADGVTKLIDSAIALGESIGVVKSPDKSSTKSKK